MTITPLHIATVGGHPLRFFKTPLNDGRPDLVWHAVDDLQHCLVAPGDKERAGTDHHCTGAKLLRLVESSVDLPFSICMQNVNLLSDGARSLLHVVQLGLECRPARMEQHGN